MWRSDVTGGVTLAQVGDQLVLARHQVPLADGVAERRRTESLAQVAGLAQLAARSVVQHALVAQIHESAK
jgi:hypothetical protein